MNFVGCEDFSRLLISFRAPLVRMLLIIAVDYWNAKKGKKNIMRWKISPGKNLNEGIVSRMKRKARGRRIFLRETYFAKVPRRTWIFYASFAFSQSAMFSQGKLSFLSSISLHYSGSTLPASFREFHLQFWFLVFREKQRLVFSCKGIFLCSRKDKWKELNAISNT